MYASRFGQFSETAGGLDSCGLEAPCGEGSGACVHPFSFVISLFFLPSPYFSISYLGLVLSSSRQRTRMSRNSSSGSQVFVTRASTGNILQ